MRTSETVKEIAKALAAAQGMMKNPEANEEVKVYAKKDAGGGLLYTYKYATFPKCLDAAREPLSKNGISHTATVTPIPNTTKVQLVTRFTHESGEWYESEVELNAALEPKTLAGNITFFKRYQFNGLAGIAGGDDIVTADGDHGPDQSASPKPQRPAPAAKTQPKPAKPKPDAADATQIPFGPHNTKLLKDVPQNSLTWYIDFYAKTKEPAGAAGAFKPIFMKFALENNIGMPEGASQPIPDHYPQKTPDFNTDPPPPLKRPKEAIVDDIVREGNRLGLDLEKLQEQANLYTQEHFKVELQEATEAQLENVLAHYKSLVAQ